MPRSIVDRPPTPHPRMLFGRPPFRAHDPDPESNERSPLLRHGHGDHYLERPSTHRSWSFPFASPWQPAPKPTWQQSVQERAAEEIDELRERVQEIEDRAQASIFRLMMRAAWYKLRHKKICGCC